jgi:aerobic-type carbon monoxide dehydrogenase small subunit (CoxS/CutS family)
VNNARLCAECGQPGATTTGICLACTVDAMDGKPVMSVAALAVQRYWQEMRARGFNSKRRER